MALKGNNDNLTVRPSWLSFMVVRGSSCCGCSLRAASVAAAIVCTLFDVVDIGLAAFSMTMGTSDLWSEGIGMGFSVLSIIANILLLFGAFKRSPSLTVPFLVLTAIFVVLGVIVAPITLVGVIYLAVTGSPLVNWITIVIVVFIIIYIGLNIYFFAIVFSFYTELKNVQDMELVPGVKGGEEEGLAG